MPDRFSEVTKGLFRGGRPSPQELVALKNKGIKKIVSLDEESGKAISPICKELGIEQVLWGLGDGTDPKVSALKKRVVPQLLHGGPTYVHCYHGKDRTGMTIAMFRIYSGWDVSDALAEAYRFGMGKGLSRKVRNSYYEAVRQFAKELSGDKSEADDVVSLMREQNSFGPQGTGLDDMTRPRTNRTFLPPHADIEFSELSRTASDRIYCKCRSSNVLTPKTIWWSSKTKAMQNPMDEDGQLFSAQLASGTRVERFDKPVNQRIIHEILLRDIDVGALRGEQFVVVDPSSLVNIHEEDDVNDALPGGWMPGSHDNSTQNVGLQYAYPGSSTGIGGMPDGAAGVVQAPYGNQV